MNEVNIVAAGPVGSVAPATQRGSVSRELEIKPRPSERLADSVEFSERAMYLDRLRALPEVRTAVVSGVREQIDAGEYSIVDRLGVAIERLLEDIEA